MNEIALISFGDLSQMANTMAKSRMFGKTPEQMLALMLIAQAEGIHPAIAAMEYDIIQGSPALKGQAALARFQQAGGQIQWIVRTDTEAKAIFRHPAGGELTVSWTLARAAKMGLDGKDNWKKQPGIMLSWRCVAEGVRAIYPACLNRMYLAEEVQDFEPMRTVSPEPEQIPENIVKVAGIDYKALAAELTAKAGLTKDEKAAMFNDCGKDVKVYCEKLENLLNSLPPAAPDVSEILFTLEEYENSESCPDAAKADIRAALDRKETDITVLTALLNKVKTASGN